MYRQLKTLAVNIGRLLNLEEIILTKLSTLFVYSKDLIGDNNCLDKQ